MNDSAFRALLNLFMCDDPSVLNNDLRKQLEDFMNGESGKRGYANWIDAYHYLDKEGLSECQRKSSVSR